MCSGCVFDAVSVSGGGVSGEAVGLGAGGVTLVMNDRPHGQPQCTVSSRPATALSSKVEASCCLLP